MSGNSERLTIEESEVMFRNACPHCKNAEAYDFRTRNGLAVRVGWYTRDESYYVNNVDWRITYKSFAKHPIRCLSCRHNIDDEILKNKLIMMVKKGSYRWRRQYAEEFGVKDV